MSSTAFDCSKIDELMEKTISEKCLVVFSFTTCHWCYKLKAALHANAVPHHVVEIDKMNLSPEAKACMLQGLENRSGIVTVPQVFLDGKFVGGAAEIIPKARNGQLYQDTQICIKKFAEYYEQLKNK